MIHLARSGNSGDRALNIKSVTTLRNSHPRPFRPRNHRRQYCVEQRLRDESIEWRAFLSALDGPDIRPRPAEAVEFGDHDPAAFGIKAKMGLYPRRDFEGVAGLCGRLRRHRHDEQLGVTVHLLPRDHDDDGALLAAILLAADRLMRPQVRIGQDVRASCLKDESSLRAQRSNPAACSRIGWIASLRSQ